MKQVRVVVYIPEREHAALKKYAKENGIYISHLCGAIIRKGIDLLLKKEVKVEDVLL